MRAKELSRARAKFFYSHLDYSNSQPYTAILRSTPIYSHHQQTTNDCAAARPARHCADPSRLRLTPTSRKPFIILFPPQDGRSSHRLRSRHARHRAGALISACAYGHIASAWTLDTPYPRTARGRALVGGRPALGESGGVPQRFWTAGGNLIQ